MSQAASATRRLARLCAALGLAFGAAGCAPVLLGADIASLQTTDRSLVDHAVSAATKMDCSSVRAGYGGQYCMDEAQDAPPPPEPYCYRTLGQINCYGQPDPYHAGYQVVR
jgi:hypothetical protein